MPCIFGGRPCQPTNDMSWLEPVARAFLQSISASCICIAACQYGMKVAKSWISARGFSKLSTFACACPHPRGSHVHVQGQLTASGPILVFPLLSSGGCDYYNLHSATATIPWKPVDAFPQSSEDGGGLSSQPDWSGPRSHPDVFESLRKTRRQNITARQLHKQLMVHISR